MLNNIIYFDKEGGLSDWESRCLPIGCGKLGASMLDGVRHERIVLNEKSLWAGGPCERRPDYYGGNKRGVYEHVREAQRRLSRGEDVSDLLPKLTGESDFGTYLLLCDAELDLALPQGEAENYRRQLDLDSALYSCKFTLGGVRYERAAFACFPLSAAAFAFSASERSLSFTMRLAKTHPADIYGDGDTLVYKGHVEDNGMKLEARFKVVTDGELEVSGNGVAVSGASSAVIWFSASTDYEMSFPRYRRTLPENEVRDNVEKAAALGWDKAFELHLRDYRALFGRASFTLHGDHADLPADKLLAEYRKGSRAAMNTLEELYFAYGRYLLIASSREGSLPANLQGVWNESNTPPWCCDYHINVNLQMNYWCAYSTNLAETALPLIAFIDSLREPGRVTAAEYYGIKSDESAPENGWTAHTQCSPFGWTAPGWDFRWGWSTAAAAWLMLNIWEYYEFTGDRDMLRERIFPIMRETARFYTQWLIYDERQGRMVSSPSYSPEHGPVTAGNTYEQSLIEQFFADFLEASEVVGEDGALREKAREALPLLKPYSVSRTGLLKEWFEEDDADFDRSAVQREHRHISHLLGLYPGDRITAETPELMTAAVSTLNDRGDGQTGWARAHRVSLRSRTGDGERAYKALRGLLESCTYENLWDFHPPFQIDGNLGGAAGIAEMLIQSHGGVVRLLPALPKEWSSGEFTGLCARGGFTVSAKWENGSLVSAEVFSEKGGALRLSFPARGKVRTVGRVLAANERYILNVDGTSEERT